MGADKICTNQMVSARGGVRQHWTEGGINLVCCKSKKETMYMFDPVTHSNRFQLRVESVHTGFPWGMLYDVVPCRDVTC